MANSRQFDFRLTTLRTSGNHLPWHKLWLTHLGTRVARVETNLPTGFESLSYRKHYITFINLHKYGGGMRGGVFNGNAEPQLWWLCQVSLQWSLQCYYNGAHTFIKNAASSWENTKQNTTEVEEREREQSKVPAGSFHMRLHTACVRLSISPHSLSCLLSPPGLPIVLPVCFQSNSSCQDCIPDPSAPAVRSYVLNLHSAFFFTHLEEGSPKEAINTIA